MPLIQHQSYGKHVRQQPRQQRLKTDRNFETEELDLGPVPPMVEDINFNFNRRETCEQEQCQLAAFLRCADCGKLLCLQHFLERVCFHNGSEADLHQHDLNLSDEESDKAEEDGYHYDELRA